LLNNIVKQKEEESEKDEKEKEEEKEDPTLKILKLIKTDTYQKLREETKTMFNITQKQTLKSKIERTIKCKSQGCQVEGKIILLGKSEQVCELHLNQYSQKRECEQQTNLFHTSEMKMLLQGNLKPNELIVNFNKNSEQKLPNDEATRRKISQLKYFEKQKSNINEEINNVKDLKAWLEARFKDNIVEDSFQSLSWDEPFVSDFEIKGADFYSFLTTKNLIYNIVKQNLSNVTHICVDGTYKLNNLGYPTIVIGTLDLHRKFHLSNILFYLILIA